MRSKFDISSKSLSMISKKKKNAFIWIGLAVVVVAFIFSIYNAIDMKEAIRINNLMNKELHNPNIVDANKTKSNTKIAWAINIENTIDGMELKQKTLVMEMAKQTKDEIVRSNGIVLEKIDRTNMIIKGKMSSLEDSNTNLTNELKALREQRKNDFKMLNSRLKQQQEDIKDIVEDGVMLPPPPLQSNKKEKSEGGLFSKIDIFEKKVMQKKTEYKKQDFQVISFKNELADVNTSLDKELTKEQIDAQNTYEIVTGFTDAYLITGAYVPLFAGSSGGSGASGTPQNVPVLMESNGDLLMPNLTVGSIDKCFLLGVATGNAGARAVEIRLDKMTCLLDGGKKVIQGEVSGYVVSETGSPGLPATMIYKAGDFIARMITAGVLEGLSTAVTNLAASGGSGGNGLDNTVIRDVTAGAGNGMNNAFSKLADFYLQLAEATMPILEVKPGRFISVVLVGGNKFQIKDVNLLDTRELDGYIDDFIGDE